MIATGPIEAFFKPPTEAASAEGDCLLYHLRTDLESLYGSETTRSSVSPSHALLATTGILNGIDYLSQVYSTKKTQRERFSETLHGLLGLAVSDAEALYQLRCALVHQVGLSVVSRSYKKGTRFIFGLSDDATGAVISCMSTSSVESVYTVGFWKLKGAFVALVNALRQVCEDPGHSDNAKVVNGVGKMHSEKILKRG